MSEFPWDKKKDDNDDDDEKSSEPPSFDNVPDISTLASENKEKNTEGSSTDSKDEKSSSKQAPDVLLNAFDNEPMEEVEELEPVESEEKDESVSDTDKTELPPFDDVPDLSNLVSEGTENGKGNDSDNSNTTKKSSFEQPPDILQNAFANDPMEEVEVLEHTDSDKNEHSSESGTTDSPPFDGVPDLTNLVSDGNKNSNDEASSTNEVSDNIYGTDNELSDEQQPMPSFGEDLNSSNNEGKFSDTDINIDEPDIAEPFESKTETELESPVEDEYSPKPETNFSDSTEEPYNQSNEIDSASSAEESGDFSSSFKNKFKSITQRRNLFDQLDEAQSEGLPVAKPVNRPEDESKSLDTFKNKFQDISYDGNLTNSIERLRGKVDKFKIKTNQNAEGSPDDNESSIEPSSPPLDQDFGSEDSSSPHPNPDEQEIHSSFEDLSNKPENEEFPEQSKFETNNEQSDKQPSFEPVTETTKTEPDNHKNSAYREKFSDLTSFFKNKFKNIRKKTAGSNEKTEGLDKNNHNTEDLTPPPLFEPDIPEEMESTGEESDGTDEISSGNEFDEPDKKPKFKRITKLKPNFKKIFSPFQVLFKSPSNRKSLKNQMEQMRNEIEEEKQEEASTVFVPPFEQETDENKEEKTSKVGKISGFFKSITNRGGLKKRMKNFRKGITSSKEGIEFDSSTVGIENQGQFTGQPAGLSFEQVDRLINKKLNEQQKQIKDVVDKKIDKVFSKEYMDYIASRVSTNQAGNLQELQSKVNGSTNRVEKITDDLQNLSNSVDELEDSLKEIQRRNEDFESKIDNAYYSTSDRIDNIEYQFKSLQDSLGISPEGNGKVSSIETRIDEIEGALDSAQSDNQDVKAELSNIQQSISDMYNSYKDLLSHLNEVNEDYESKFSDLYDKVSKIDSVESKISEIDNKTKYRDESLSRLEDDISVIKNAIKRNRKENQSLANSIEDLKQSSTITSTENTESKSNTSGKNVQLVYIPKNSISMRICMEWLKYLMNQVGGNNLEEVLTYYKNLGWISDDVRQELLRYSEGINSTSEKSDWKLTKADHIKSIWFIQKLAGSNFDFDSLQNIEKDVNQIKESN